MSMNTAKWTLWSRYFWVALLTGAGLSHFFLDQFLLAQMPGYMPYPLAMIHVSGIIELLLAVGLLFKPTRRMSWYVIAAMCTAYLPVHWHVAYHCGSLAEVNGMYHLPCWLAWLRIPIQLAFIAWTARLARMTGAFDMGDIR